MTPPAPASGLAGLDDERAGWAESAWAEISRKRLRELVTGLVDIASPTGDEAAVARHAAQVLGESGLEARVVEIDERQANAAARLRGRGHGPDLLLYAPIDTLTVGEATEDVPWIGPELRADMQPRAQLSGDLVLGLGAGNPKGHAACVMAAAEAIARAGVPLEGDLLVGLGAGGMPTNARPSSGRRNTGQGAGCSFLLEQGWWTDFAVIAKPGWAVSWEEVGLAWFDVTVHGTHTYVGSRHLMPYRNAVADAGRVAAALEDWFPVYAARHRDGLVEPQGIVAAVEGGWMRMAAVTPAACRLRVDLRISPRTTPAQAKREFGAALAHVREQLPAVELDWEMVLAIPGTSTDAGSWVCRSAIAAWEAIAGREHQPPTGMSGATDANILRGRGIPTARVGMPKVTEAYTPVDFALGMNSVDVRQMELLTRLLVRVVVDTVTRTTAEVGR
ncbi:MAG: deacylase [bacterium]